MDIEQWWPRLAQSAREWLVANNGDEVPSEIVEEIEAAGGPGLHDSWWGDEVPKHHAMPDTAVDWIEASANDEPTDVP